MKTVADIIALWPSAEHFASALGCKYPSYGRVMKMRGRIPEKFWPKVARLANAFGSDLTEDELASIHARAREACQPVDRLSPSSINDQSALP